MADKKITQLPLVTSVSDSDLLPIVTGVGGSPVTGAVSALTLRNYAVQSLERLAANRTYYVRTDGSDTNNGLSNSASGAFRTIQRAVNAAQSVNWNGYAVTIQVVDGNYNETVVVRGWPFGASTGLTITGNVGNPAAVNLSGGFLVSNGAWVNLSGMKISGSTNALYAQYGGLVMFSAIDFGALTGSYYHIFAFASGRVEASGNYTVSGGATYHMYALESGTVRITGKTMTFTANCTFTAFANAGRLSQIIAFSNTYALGGFTVTGQRYVVSLNSIIETNGGGANYFPGSTAGVASNGGLYT